ARATLESDMEPAAVLDALRKLPGKSGAIACAYLDSAGYRVLNSYDVLDPYGLEAPFVIVEGLRVLLPREAPKLARRADESKTKLRDAVPDAHRSEFDTLFEEAMFISPLRDERVLFNDTWSAGVTRRALLEVGRRLVARQLLDKAEHATV